MALKQLVEKRNELEAVQARLGKIYEQAKGDPAGNGDLDLDNVTEIKGDAKVKLAEIRKLTEKSDELGAEVDTLAKIEAKGKSLAAEHGVKGGEDEDAIGRFAQEADTRAGKGFGTLLVESEEFKAWTPGRRSSFELRGGTIPLLKTEFTTSAGFAPESTRIGRLVYDAVRPIQVIDTVPGGATSQAQVIFMEETTATSAAAERSESGAYAESEFAWTEQSSTVRSIGHSLPVTDEQLEDVPMIESILNQRMSFFVRQRLDGQILDGDGSAPNLRGFNNLSGVQTQAKGADPVPDAIYKAMKAVRVTGRAQPSVVYIHPNDWQGVRLLRTTDGIYIWGNPSEAGPMRIWGVLVVETDAQDEDTALVADATNFSQLFMRRDVTVEMGYKDDDFTDGRVTIRAGLRAALVAYRDAAFCQVTGI